MIPKFKFWDKDNNEFILFPHNIVLNIDGTVEGIEYEMPREGNVYNDITYFELLQSTGLFDKNGKEIFEGDIIRNNYGELGNIKWSRGGFVYHEDGANFYLFSIGAGQPFEILGNIYEHPHLLGEE